MIVVDGPEDIAPTVDPRVGWYSVGTATPPGPPYLPTWWITWDADSHNFTGASFELVTATPEPTTGALVLVGVAACARVLRRRRPAR